MKNILAAITLMAFNRIIVIIAIVVMFGLFSFYRESKNNLAENQIKPSESVTAYKSIIPIHETFRTKTIFLSLIKK